MQIGSQSEEEARGRAEIPEQPGVVLSPREAETSFDPFHVDFAIQLCEQMLLIRSLKLYVPQSE